VAVAAVVAACEPSGFYDAGYSKNFKNRTPEEFGDVQKARGKREPGISSDELHCRPRESGVVSSLRGA